MNISSIRFIGENKPKHRKLKVRLSNGAKITIEPCHESWQQFGGTVPELQVTVPVADRYNDWLHGGVLPF